MFEKISQLQDKLNSLRPLDESEIRRLREEFIIDNTFHSNKIEGSTMSLRETALILKEDITIAEKPLREHLEVIGHRDAFEFIESLVDAQTPLTEQIVKQIHTLVLMHDNKNKGIYRQVPVRILGAIHTPPQPFSVPEQMTELLKDYTNWRLNKRHIIECVTEFHLRFEGIHPFIDGNGRTGRLILNFELMKAGLLPINIKFSDQTKYYDCFDEYHVKHQSIHSLATLITGYEEEELTRYIDIIEQKNKFT